MRLVVLGLSITSSWGNGHATTFRALLRGMAARGHEVSFLERDVPWYAANRDLPEPPFCRTFLYGEPGELKERFAGLVADADTVMVGSYVPDGIEVAAWACATARGVTAFYDIDTPVTLAALERGECAYLAPGLIPGFDLYLSFTGGPVLERLEKVWGARAARPLYCSVDTDAYRPTGQKPRLALGYLGTYSPDRQPGLDSLLLEPARRCPKLRFAVAGPQYPAEIAWPANVERTEHLPPAAHPGFYGAQLFTLNVTRADMRAAGHAPSVRLFEAAACGVPVISDRWPGIEELFRPGEEILLAERPEEVVALLQELPEERRRAIGAAARERVLRAHGAEARAGELETWLEEARRARPGAGRPAA
ncbi:CgeB family protein [Marinimicrococcus flavescens]|uniref:Glycosyltransferase n=1 Tax=Marinimicrococcus flavescens TaxID=3031815 RepID=A0AAP3XQH5_9PROT|nr:glycosyltransferase [Marinimicrococcus flavescens]